MDGQQSKKALEWDMNVNMNMGLGVNNLSPLSPVSPVPLDSSLVHPHAHAHMQQTGGAGTVTTTGLFDAYDSTSPPVSTHAQGTLGTVEFGNVFGAETASVPGVVGSESIPIGAVGVGMSPPVSPTTPEQTPLAGHIEA